MEVDDEIDVPKYFLCPISLQIMRDPVTAVTGITYDRESIRQWLLTAEEAVCPVTKQPMSRDDSELTPNHMLRRLIQAWCVANDGIIDRIPTPKSPPLKSQVLKIIRETRRPSTALEAVRKLDLLAIDWEQNGNCLAEAGVVRGMVGLIVRCFKDGSVEGVEEGFRVFCNVWRGGDIGVHKEVVEENHDFVDAIFWVLKKEDFENHVVVKTLAISAFKLVSEVSGSSLFERLTLDDFKEIIGLLRTKKISEKATKSALHVLIEACQWGRNKLKIIESGAIFELVELELRNTYNQENKRTTELTFCLLARLCSIADGRQLLLKHAGAIAVLTKRTLRVSPATDEYAVQILAMIARSAATREVLSEMLKVGAVSKLCMILQADCQAHLKKIAREILRLHSSAWTNSPCIQIYLLTMHAR